MSIPIVLSVSASEEIAEEIAMEGKSYEQVLPQTEAYTGVGNGIGRTVPSVELEYGRQI